MYTAVLLFVAALLIHDPAPSRLVAAGALVAVLTAKVRFEEAALNEKFPDYAVYAQRTGRFFPRFRHSRVPSNSR
jgi:protein-S-isoprenylcysteine O-methyltransferase Ste14